MLEAYRRRNVLITFNKVIWLWLLFIVYQVYQASLGGILNSLTYNYWTSLYLPIIFNRVVWLCLLYFLLSDCFCMKWSSTIIVRNLFIILVNLVLRYINEVGQTILISKVCYRFHYVLAKGPLRRGFTTPWYFLFLNFFCCLKAR